MTVCRTDKAFGGFGFPTAGFHFVQLVIDGAEVLTPLLPIGYGCTAVPITLFPLRGGGGVLPAERVPHGSVRREYSAVTDTWESCLVYTPPEYEEERSGNTRFVSAAWARRK